MSFLTIKALQTPRNVILCFSKLKIDFDIIIGTIMIADFSDGRLACTIKYKMCY